MNSQFPCGKFISWIAGHPVIHRTHRTSRHHSCMRPEVWVTAMMYLRHSTTLIGGPMARSWKGSPNILMSQSKQIMFKTFALWRHLAF
jgi:hypothetical protein